MLYLKSSQVLFVVCIPHLGKYYCCGREHEPLRFLTVGRHMTDKPRCCALKSITMLSQRPHFPQAASHQ